MCTFRCMTPIRTWVITVERSLRLIMIRNSLRPYGLQKSLRYWTFDHIATPSCSQATLRRHVRLWQTQPRSFRYSLMGQNECSSGTRTTGVVHWIAAQNIIASIISLRSAGNLHHQQQNDPKTTKIPDPTLPRQILHIGPVLCKKCKRVGPRDGPC